MRNMLQGLIAYEMQKKFEDELLLQSQPSIIKCIEILHNIALKGSNFDESRNQNQDSLYKSDQLTKSDSSSEKPLISNVPQILTTRRGS